MKKYNIFLSLFIIYIIINMIIFPKIYIEQTLNGISAWAFNVLPSVLPFIFLTKVLTSLKFTQKTSKVFKKPCKILFNTPPESAYVFLTSIISGYPVGAKMTADLYQNGQITKKDAYKMTSFCSTSGPMFIVGAVGAMMLGNALLGYIIFTAHILGAIINGIIYRNITLKEKEQITESSLSPKTDLSSIVLDSALSIISVGTIIAIFFVVITSLSPIFNLLPATLAAFLKGLIEITRGCLDISSTLSPFWATILSTFIISFGGISTILQSLTMLDKLQMPVRLFVLQKFTHAIFSCIIAVVLTFIFL